MRTLSRTATAARRALPVRPRSPPRVPRGRARRALRGRRRRAGSQSKSRGWCVDSHPERVGSANSNTTRSYPGPEVAATLRRTRGGVPGRAARWTGAVAPAKLVSCGGETRAAAADCWPVSRGSWPPQALMTSGARATTMATRGIGRVYTRPSRLRRDGTRGVGYKEVRPDFDLRGGPMSRRVRALRPKALGAAAAAQPVEIDSYFDKVLKYIPADIVAAWVAVTGLVSSARY